MMPGLISIIIIIDGKIMLVTDFTSPVNTGNHFYFLYLESFSESIKKKPAHMGAETVQLKWPIST